MMKAVGLLFIALGHVVGAAIVLEPLGLLRVRTGFAASILFLVLITAGYLIVAVASRLAAVHLLTRVLASTLLLLAALAAVVLVILVMGPEYRAAAIAPVAFVLAISALFGVFSLLGIRPIATTPSR